MSVDLTSDENIAIAHQSIRDVDSPIDWLLVGYPPEGSKDRLYLAARGPGGLDALAHSMKGRAGIQFGLLRIQGRFLFITLLPEDAGGVRRARALVHSRAVGSKMPHQASVTITRATDLTLELVRSKLKLNLETGSPSSSLPNSPNPQSFSGNPSPLRAQFSPPLNAVNVLSQVPQNGYKNTPVKRASTDAPPNLPEKDAAQLSRMQSNTSLQSSHSYAHSPRIAPSSFQPPSPNPGRSADSAPQATGLGLGLPSSTSHHIRSVSSPAHPSSQLPALPSFAEHGAITFEKTNKTSPSLHEDTIASLYTSAPVMIPVDGSRKQPQLTTSNIAKQIAAENIARAVEEKWRSQPSSPVAPVAARSQTPPNRSPTPPTHVESSVPAPTQDTRRRDPTRRESVRLSIERDFLEKKLRAEQDRLAALQVGNNALENARDEARSEPVDALREQPSTEVPEKQILQNVLEVEQERLAALKAEEEQLLLYKRHAEEEARLNAEAKEREEEERTRQESEEQARLAEEERMHFEEQQRLQSEKQAEQERLRKQQEEEAILARRRAEEAESEAKREQEETKLRAAREAREAEVKTIRERHEAKLLLRDNLKKRIEAASDPQQTVLTGYVSSQGGSSILWRRRFFEMSASSLRLFKSDRDKRTPVDTITVPNHVKAIQESAEELMSIPHSFKLSFNDYDEEPMLFYCDEEDDKELLVYSLRLVARLS